MILRYEKNQPPEKVTFVLFATSARVLENRVLRQPFPINAFSIKKQQETLNGHQPKLKYTITYWQSIKRGAKLFSRTCTFSSFLLL